MAVDGGSGDDVLGTPISTLGPAYRECTVSRPQSRRLQAFLVDENGSHLVESILLTAIIVLGTGVVLIQLREAFSNMFIEVLGRYLGWE